MESLPRSGSYHNTVEMKRKERKGMFKDRSQVW